MWPAALSELLCRQEDSQNGWTDALSLSHSIVVVMKSAKSDGVR